MNAFSDPTCAACPQQRVVSRSNEAKALGIAMGEPYFKLRDLIALHGIEVFSSNYALYGNLSARVMSVLRDLAPHIEVYSINEAFLDLTGLNEPLPIFGRRVKAEVQRLMWRSRFGWSDR